MARTVWLVLAGAVVGFGATALFLGRNDGRDAGVGSAAGTGSGAPAASSFAGNLAAFESASSAVDTADLEASIEGAAAQRPSWRRDAELEALLARLVETQPRAAVDLAERLGLGDELLARLFQAWADTDPEAALARLGGLNSVSARRVVALALLDVLGLDGPATATVAAVLPPVEANNFVIHAIGKAAEQDLVGALERALSLKVGQAETAAEQQIAVVMARLDPYAALEYSDMIPVPVQRIRYRDRLLDEWAKIDPEAMLGYLATSPDLTEVLVGEAGFQALATSAPEKLLAVADQFSPQQRARAQAAALDVLAELDPVAAFNRVRSLPPGGDRDNYVGVIAERYAEQDPEAALAWVTALEPKSLVAFNAVLSGIGESDPVRAADLAIAEILNPAAANRTEMPSVTSILSAPMQAGSPAIAMVADKLAAHGDPRVRAQLNSLILVWPQADPSAATAWALRNTDSLRTDSASGLARQLAAEDPALARQSLQRLPEKLRGAWVEGAASGWADQDPTAAQGWVLGLAAGPIRDGGLASLVRQAANQGTVDSRLLDAFSSAEARAQAVSSIMLTLGTRNPELGRRLITEQIQDPQLRQIAERQLEAGAELRNRLPAGVIQLR